MIVDAIINGLFSVLTGMMSLFPDIPAMPAIITTGWNYFIEFTAQATGLLVYLLTPALYIMAIGLIIFMTSFQYIYHFLIRFVIFRVAMGFLKR